MKLAYALAALLLTSTFSPPALASAATAQVQSSAGDTEAASFPLENYIKALETGDAAYARLAFHKEARMIGNNRAGYVSMPIEEWMSGFQGKPSDDEAERRRSFQIIDLIPTTGVARVELAYPGVTMVDYMTLLKVDGEWKIMNKLFHVMRPAPPAD